MGERAYVFRLMVTCSLLEKWSIFFTAELFGAMAICPMLNADYPPCFEPYVISSVAPTPAQAGVFACPMLIYLAAPSIDDMVNLASST